MSSVNDSTRLLNAKASGTPGSLSAGVCPSEKGGAPSAVP